jgi:protease IV
VIKGLLFMKNVFKSALGSALGIVIGSMIAFMILPFVLVLLLKGASQMSEPVKPKSILHLRLSGELIDRQRPLDFDFLSEKSLFGSEKSLGLFELGRAIDRAKADKRVEGIYLEIRDFNAGWAGISALRRKLEEFSAEGKWVISYAERMDEMGYYLASSSSQIYMQPHGEIEFNGLSVSPIFLKGMMSKLEVEPRIFRVGKFKAAVEPFLLDKMSDENREQMQTLIDDVWGTVRQSISKALGMESGQLDDLAANLEMLSVTDAVGKGFIKEAAYEDVVESVLKQKTVGPDHELELVTPGRYLREKRPLPTKGVKKIAVIFADGEIHSGVGRRGEIGSQTLREEIQNAKSDEDVAAIVVRVNSPGGDALASDVIWRELRTTDDELPVVVSLGDIAASGGYYIAAAGRYIYAEPMTITGSIGVFGVLFGTEKFFKNKAGVNFDRAVTHPYSDIGNFNRPISQFESQRIQSEVERVYKRFLDVVQDGRGYEKRSDLESIAEGRVWSGAKAKELGLVDELGGLDQAVAKAAEFAGLGKDYQIRAFPESKDPFSSFIERYMGDSFEMLHREIASRTIGEEGMRRLQEVARTVIPMKNGVHARLPFDLRIR